MIRVFSCQRLYSGNGLKAAEPFSDLDSKRRTKFEDDGYFLGSYIDEDGTEDSSTPMKSKISVAPFPKKCEWEYYNLNKNNQTSMRRAYSCCSLHSEINHTYADTHTIPSKVFEIPRTFSLTKLNLKSTKLNVELLNILQQKKKGTTIDRSQKKSSKIIRLKGRSIQSSTRSYSFFNARKERVKYFSKDESSISLSTLPDDVMLLIMSSLTPSELRALMCTDTRNLKLCRNECVWTNFCDDEWQIEKIIKEPERNTKNNSFFNSCTKIKLCDDLSIPCSSKTEQQSNHTIENEVSEPQKNTNLSVLLHLTQPYPVKVDDYFFEPQFESDFSVDTEHEEEVKPIFRTFKMRTARNTHSQYRKVEVVQFTSNVGTGDRCIRSNKPFPSICLSKCSRYSNFSLFGSLGRVKGKMLKSYILPSSSPFHNIFKKKFLSIPTIKPFVAPTVSKVEEIQNNGRKELIYTLNVTPRLFAYFEITLMSRDEAQEPSPLLTSQQPTTISQARNVMNDNNPDSTSTSSDCVAIGLSTATFHTSSKMPGWDRYSYGYHGDDGGIFHAGGVMVRRYGPTFGVGDTVGCGINYANQGIFFTLNGKFLGYGWTGIDLTDQLYPTIGIDTRNPIELNFGSKPFVYDTTAFSNQHVSLIDNLLRTITNGRTKSI